MSRRFRRHKNTPSDRLAAVFVLGYPHVACQSHHTASTNWFRLSLSLDGLGSGRARPGMGADPCGESWRTQKLVGRRAERQRTPRAEGPSGLAAESWDALRELELTCCYLSTGFSSPCTAAFPLHARPVCSHHIIVLGSSFELQPPKRSTLDRPASPRIPAWRFVLHWSTGALTLFSFPLSHAI